MKPYYQDNHIELYAKDCREMTEMADNSVQCVVTSPPYWGLRKYSGEQELIWGDNHCEYLWGETIEVKGHHAGETNPGKEGYTKDAEQWSSSRGGFCSLCGAWKGAYGLEPTPEMYVQHTIEILREIRRVLRKDGVVFLNMGDSYFGGDRGGSDYGGKEIVPSTIYMRPKSKHNILKPKDLCLIPFRIAIAAQEDGWWVRSVIIWSKPNPMPESVTDRPTESHEYILMLTKSARYYWDADAVREPYDLPEQAFRVDKTRTPLKDFASAGIQDAAEVRNRTIASMNKYSGRNIRTVWEFPTQPYPEAHFAVFPEKLPELCIKAATPDVGCCSKCGAPWERETERDANPKDAPTDYKTFIDKPSQVKRGDALKSTMGGGHKRQEWLNEHPKQTLGWQPTCKCREGRRPSLVLDPFAGAGTTLWVAKKLNRKAVGYEISEEYCQLALDRNRQQVLALT